MQDKAYLTVKRADPFVWGMVKLTNACNQGVEQHPCPPSDLCPLAQCGNCKPYGRLHVNLDESDELGTFIFRTTGFNSIRTLAARLSYYHAASNGLLSCLPLQLTLRGKSTTLKLSNTCVSG